MAFHLNESRLEACLLFQYLVGVSFIFGSKFLGRSLAKGGAYSDKPGRKALVQRLKIELARKSFHIISGTTIVACYHFGLKFGICSSAWQLEEKDLGHPISAATLFAPWSLGIWSIEFMRMVFPSMNTFIFKCMHGVVREKEQASASGMSYFLPGALAAMISYPPSQAMLAIIFLTMGDAAAGLGTAVGTCQIANTPRKLEGTISFFLVATGISLWLMDGVNDPGLLLALAMSSSFAAAVSELWAEIIRFDDNLFVPVVGGYALHYLVDLIVAEDGQRSRVLTMMEMEPLM